jgi:hypothetical protein
MSENTNGTSRFRRVVATLTIGSFSVAALMGIAALLGGGDFGDNEARVLLTTLIVGSASICVLCYLATSGTRWAVVGFAGDIVLVLPVVTALILVWSDWSGDGEGTLKAFGVGVVLALTLAQLSLLLALAGDGRLGAILWPTIAIAVAVAAMVSALILGAADGDDVWRVLGVLAILDVLGTLVTIALAKFADRDTARTPDHRLSVVLSADQSDALTRLSASSGRTPEQLVGDAVDRLLRS